MIDPRTASIVYTPLELRNRLRTTVGRLLVLPTAEVAAALDPDLGPATHEVYARPPQANTYSEAMPVVPDGEADAAKAMMSAYARLTVLDGFRRRRGRRRVRRPRRLGRGPGRRPGPWPSADRRPVSADDLDVSPRLRPMGPRPRRLRTQAKLLREPSSPVGPVAGRGASVATLPAGDPATAASARDIAGGVLCTGAVERVAHQRDDVPPGCVRQAEFARRVGCAKSVITRWIKVGLPMHGVFVDWEPAKAWFDTSPIAAAVRRANAPGLDFKTYAQTVGYTSSTVQRLVREGLPLNSAGKVDPAVADPWVADRRLAKGRHRDDRGRTWAIPPEPKAAQEDPAETVVGVVTRLGFELSSAGCDLRPGCRGNPMGVWTATGSMPGWIPVHVAQSAPSCRAICPSPLSAA